MSISLNHRELRNLVKHFFLMFISLAKSGLSCNMWDLVPWPGMEPRPATMGALSLSHRITREVPKHYFWVHLWGCFRKMSNVSSRWSKANCLFHCGWALFNLLKVWVRTKKRRERFLPLCLGWDRDLPWAFLVLRLTDSN